MPSAALREAVLQQTLADLVLEPDEAAFTEDPAGFARSRGVEERDAAHLAGQEERLLLYRELARNALTAPLENALPISQALLGEDAWADATTAFLATRRVQGPYYRDVAPAFVAWLAETAWGRDRWPALLELAHYELMEILVVQATETCRQELATEPNPDHTLVLDPAAHVLSYHHAVHRATETAPDPHPEPAHLLLHRDAAEAFSVLELTPSTAALLVRAQDEPLGCALEALGLTFDDDLKSLLLDLKARGALLGFRA